MYRACSSGRPGSQYVGGDNRLPNNNEFFFNWNPDTQTFGRSGIHHNILGAYNFMLVDDIAGVRPRLDDRLELWPIDVGWDHFAVNNLHYHGRDLTLVWDRPDGDRHYPGSPRASRRTSTGGASSPSAGLAHVSWNSESGTGEHPRRRRARALPGRPAPCPRPPTIGLEDNDRIADMFQKAGVDLSEGPAGGEPGRGQAGSASFTTTSPPLRATVGRVRRGRLHDQRLPASGPAGQAQPGYLAPNTIWGACSAALPACGEGSPNAQEWLEVDLTKPHKIDTVKLYFFNDKNYNTQQNNSRNTYREPSQYVLQYHDGSGWVDVPGRSGRPTRRGQLQLVRSRDHRRAGCAC